MWGVKGPFEHPKDYKKRMKMAEEGEVAAEETSRTRIASSSKGLFGSLRRLFGGS